MLVVTTRIGILDELRFEGQHTCYNVRENRGLRVIRNSWLCSLGIILKKVILWDLIFFGWSVDTFSQKH